MSRADDAAPAASALAALAARSRAAPHDPWLFHRDGWDWRWRSWSRVADQVARGAAELRRRTSEPGRRIAFAAVQDPDAIAAGLAIQAAGAVAVAVRLGDREEAPSPAAWAHVDGTAPRPADASEVFVLPAALSPLERTPPQPLELDPAAPPGVLELPGGGELAADACVSAASRLAGRLPSPAGRPILCATPDLDVRAAAVLAAWTLLADAVWVLEPLTEAFVPTILWARPTVVCGGAGELTQLIARLRERKHRRHRRLAAVMLVGEAELPAAADRVFRELGISMLPESPTFFSLE